MAEPGWKGALRARGSELQRWLFSRPIALGDTGNGSAPSGFGSEPLVSGVFVEDLVLECIRRRVPVVLSGPRGCGKTRCANRAIERAVEAGYIFGDPSKSEDGRYLKRNTWGYVTAQGNKEVARDYLMEDEARIGKVDGQVGLTLKFAPILYFAERGESSKPKQTEAEELVIDPSWNANGRPFVLMLDEINRFSDGVLDSLLLLLEEGQVIRDGRVIRVNCAAVFTMNPPGYDGTAKRLSPPLQARLGRVIPLCTPDFTTTFDITDKNLGTSGKNGKRYRELMPANALALKRACLVSLALWGRVGKDSAAYRYLTHGTWTLLQDLARIPSLTAPMELLAKQCSYGPDVRGVRFWMLAAMDRRDSLQRRGAPDVSAAGVPPSAEELSDCLRYTFDHTMLHRLSTRFVEGTSAGPLRQVEEAARCVADYLLRLLPPTSPLLRTVYDDINSNARQVATLASGWGLTPEDVRKAWHAAGLSSDKELLAFVAKIADPPMFEDRSAREVLARLQGQGLVHTISEGIPLRVTTRNRTLRAFVRNAQGGLLVDRVHWTYLPSLFGDRPPDDITRRLQTLHDALLTGWDELRAAYTPPVPAESAHAAAAERAELDGQRQAVCDVLARTGRSEVAYPVDYLAERLRAWAGSGDGANGSSDAWRKQLSEDLIESYRQLTDFTALNAHKRTEAEAVASPIAALITWLLDDANARPSLAGVPLDASIREQWRQRYVHEDTD